MHSHIEVPILISGYLVSLDSVGITKFYYLLLSLEISEHWMVILIISTFSVKIQLLKMERLVQKHFFIKYIEFEGGWTQCFYAFSCR